MATDGFTVTDERDDVPVFIHRDIDDAPLSVFAYRAYGRISRRANCSYDGVLFESIDNMAKRCGMGHNTLRGALKELEAFGLIRRAFVPGKTSNITLLPRSFWRLPKPELLVPDAGQVAVPDPVGVGVPDEGHEDTPSEDTAFEGNKVKKSLILEPATARVGVPTLAQVQAFARLISAPIAEASKFWEYNQKRNWSVGGRPVGSWQALFGHWVVNGRRGKEFESKFRKAPEIGLDFLITDHGLGPVMVLPTRTNRAFDVAQWFDSRNLDPPKEWEAQYRTSQQRKEEQRNAQS